ncbi:hypothetical protein PQ472_07805 [Lacticaseibacillus pabuli]|uniref:Uncharacterized protein n=1 Tax=Lacticaseibacillus pabuli TaxID=3025672 RepID=A0ABY7WPZ3_9LACO|nr:hypothetical protein [Lacticaseibacillus sp. KACC 23028]WDF81829.1 hypothetical protein PQ472_07805 [Lacticaseibacillus sp. KACC 23028]
MILTSEHFTSNAGRLKALHAITEEFNERTGLTATPREMTYYARLWRVLDGREMIMPASVDTFKFYATCTHSYDYFVLKTVDIIPAENEAAK